MRNLLHYSLCPFSRKIRILLAEKRVPFELIEEKFWQKSPDLMLLNPMGEVPILVENSKLVITGSNAIAEFVDEALGEETFIGYKTSERVKVREIAGWFDDRFNRDVTRNLLYEKFFKSISGQGNPSSDNIRAGRSNILKHMRHIENMLAKSGEWLAGSKFTLADITGAAHLSSLDYFGDVPWAQFPYVKEWYQDVKMRDSMRDILADRVASIAPWDGYSNFRF